MSPETLFGGTWKRIEGRFLLCSGGGHDAGETGGEENHVLTVAEMPAHKHDIVAKENKSNNLGYNIVCDYPTSSYGFTGSTQTAGLGLGHNNMPPFLTVNAWERVA